MREDVESTEVDEEAPVEGATEDKPQGEDATVAVEQPQREAVPASSAAGGAPGPPPPRPANHSNSIP